MVLYAAVLLYGTLAPFHFTTHPTPFTPGGVGRLEWIPFSRLCPQYGVFCPADTGLNLAMFMPFGALAALVGGDATSKRRRVVRGVVAGFGLSLLIETTQYFNPDRFPSTTDLLLNTLGAALGALAATAFLGWRKRLANVQSP